MKIALYIITFLAMASVFAMCAGTSTKNDQPKTIQSDNGPIGQEAAEAMDQAFSNLAYYKDETTGVCYAAMYHRINSEYSQIVMVVLPSDYQIQTFKYKRFKSKVWN